MIKILEVEGTQVLVALQDGKQIWLPKQMLRQYGAKASDIKVGRTLG